ncbi:MAG: hypothetical protein HY226_05595 [Candidatus Vogelbacteria bacterium]|nr:hypothetical protein [Candidatus Vogelbacteria bacterium]
MKVPDKVIKKIEELEQRKKDQKNAIRREKRHQKKIKDALNKIREERAPELIQAAEVVVQWVKEFYDSEIGRQLLRVANPIKIFCQPYWNGLPAFGCEITTFATIQLDDKGNMKYCERYKWMPEHETFLDMNPINPVVLVEALHPDYLVDLAEHLMSNAVWEDIHLLF